MENKYDVIILGAGPAGLTAGIYLSRAKVKTLILNEGAIGGQMVLTHEIANFPGVDNISGYMLSNNMKKQAKKFGCVIKANLKVTNIDFDSEVKTVEVNGKDSYAAKAIIIATGGSARNLGVPGEKQFKGKGISYCATCDGDFYQDKDIIVVGGGNSALEEAVSLTKYASSVTVVHQFDHFQAFEKAVEEAKSNPKISFLMESRIVEFLGDNQVSSVKIESIKDGNIYEKEIDGVFIFIGYKPNSDSFNDAVNLNKYNEILADSKMKTNKAGVFAAGDVVEKNIRQITTAVSDGTIAATSCIEFLEG
jgi:thioredoxin reductase (NADPH)